MLRADDMPLAEYFPVGEFLADELDARGWSQAEFADMIERPAQFVSDIITGRKELTTTSATQFEAATGIKAATWLGIQVDYKLWSEAQDEDTTQVCRAISARAHASEKLALHHLRERGVLVEASGVAEQIALHGLAESVNDLALAARRSNPGQDMTREQLTWIVCAKHRARNIDVGRFAPARLRGVAATLARAAATESGFITLPDLLATCGVALFYEPSIAKGKVDGVTFLEGGTPVIALSGRGQRLDKVLFTLLHEVAHITLGHLDTTGFVADVAINHEATGKEGQANAQAAAWTLPDLHPPSRITASWVNGTAAELGVNRAVIIGHLQHRGYLSWQSQLARGLLNVTEAMKKWQAPTRRAS